MPGKTILVTGDAGLIGSNFVLRRVAAGCRIITLDALTYAGNMRNLKDIASGEDHIFLKGEIGDGALVGSILREDPPEAIVRLAARGGVTG